jgi:RNA polymerase sigma-70 factor (ECF subfamily)
MPPLRLRRPPNAAAGDDERLVARAQAGDREAEEAIYRRHVGYVSGMVLRLLVHPPEAEDVVQDTFVIAFEQLPRLRAGTALRPWLAQIAVSQVHRRFRRRRLLRLFGLLGGEDAKLEAVASPDLGPEAHAELAALGRALGRLPVDQRIAWSLRYVEGATLDEVAAACRCSLATAKRRIHAAGVEIQGEVDIDDAIAPLSIARAGARGREDR